MCLTTAAERIEVAPVVKVVVIGFGNTLRGDDALGPMAAEALGRRFAGRSVQTITRHTLTPELSALLAEAEHAIFIDASHGGEPGVTSESHVVPDPEAEVQLVHFLDPKALITWTRAVYGCFPKAVLLSAMAVNLDFGERLSPAMERSLEDIVQRAAARIEACLAEGAQG